MGRHRQSSANDITQDEANVERKPNIRPYKDNEALRRAHKKYYQNNKAEQVKATKDILQEMARVSKY